MKDHYATLGVARSASLDEIKQSYRRLASQHHPDKGGDTARFQEIEEAYRVLTDPESRQQYDNPQTQFNGQFGNHGFNFNDIFSMFAPGASPGQHSRRNHVRMTVWIMLRDAALGGTRTLSIGTAQGTANAQIDIPIGISDGDNVQYAKLGPGGTDLVVEFRIRPDPEWERQELNLITNRRISVFDLICGVNLTVTDIYGKDLATVIPPRTQPGSLLRLKGRGLRDQRGVQGDAFVRVQTMLPAEIAPEIIAVIAQHRR